MSESLGCYEDGEIRYIRGGRVFYRSSAFDCSWNRVADDISKGNFVVPANKDCAPPVAHVVADMIEMERNGIIEWAGYVKRSVIADGIATIDADDLLSGYQNRIIRNAINLSNTDLTEIVRAVIDAANGPDPIPVVPVYFSSGILATRLYATADYRLAWDALKNDLLNVGLDLTMVGTLLYVGPLENRGMRPLVITEQMVFGVPTTGEDAASYGNRIIGKGDNGLVSIYPPGPAVDNPDSPYPLWEVVVDASGTADQASLDKLVKEHYDLRSSTPTFVSLDEGVTLRETTPYPLRALIPSRLAEIKMDLPANVIDQAMRLQNVSYALTGGVEVIGISGVPVGSVPAGTLAA